jgi:hypothetical protein
MTDPNPPNYHAAKRHRKKFYYTDHNGVRRVAVR